MPRDENGIPSRPVHGIDGGRERGKEGGRAIPSMRPRNATADFSPRILFSSPVFLSFATTTARPTRALDRRAFRTERFRALDGIFNRIIERGSIRFRATNSIRVGSPHCEFDRLNLFNKQLSNIKLIINASVLINVSLHLFETDVSDC